jgi:hypothetical protein
MRLLCKILYSVMYTTTVRIKHMETYNRSKNGRGARVTHSHSHWTPMSGTQAITRAYLRQTVPACDSEHAAHDTDTTCRGKPLRKQPIANNIVWSIIY